MGFHQGLASESYDRKYSNKRLLSRIWRYTEPHKFKLLLILTIVLICVSGAFRLGWFHGCSTR